MTSLLSEITEGDGVGSQLWRLLTSLGVQHHTDCSCLILAKAMNILGPERCREEREALLEEMEKNKVRYGWATYLRAGVNALLTGVAFKIDPRNPLPGLLDEAIRLAEEQQLCRSGPMG